MQRADVRDAPGVAAKVEFLRRPASYPGRVAAIDVIETHLSWVFLTETEVFKLKKPVRYPFVDLSTLSARRDNCEQEIRLNRELAPDVYLGMETLRVTDGGTLQLGGEGRPVDYLVKMRRLPDSASLLAHIERRSVDPQQVDAAARKLASFYRQAEVVGNVDAAALSASISAEHRELAECLQFDGGAASLHAALDRWMAHHRALLSRRHVIEAHGDLRPQHIYLGEEPLVIDRLEFNRQLRLLDPVEELAFLTIECERLGQAWIGKHFFEHYADQTGDRPSTTLVAFYKARRALLWTLLSARHLSRGDRRSHWREIAEAYLQLGMDAMRNPDAGSPQP